MSSKQRPSSDDGPDFYLDENMGRYVVAGHLREHGLSVQTHADHLPDGATDEEWISLVGNKNWIGVTKDRNIQHRYHEHAEIVDAKAQILVLRAKDLPAIELAKILVQYRAKIVRYFHDAGAPALAGIDRYGKIKAYELIH